MFDTLAQNYIGLSCPVQINQWYHAVLVFDGSVPASDRVKLYVNGSMTNVGIYIQQGTMGTTTTNSRQYITIGATHDQGNPLSHASFFDGSIDDIRIYNRPLTAAEIDTLFHENGWTSSVLNDQVNEIPKAFALFQNYPNPFNPLTKIQYALPISSFVTIKIFNILGQEVKVLVNGYQNAGYHEITCDLSRLSSAIYLYKMNAGTFTDTKKILLLK